MTLALTHCGHPEPNSLALSRGNQIAIWGIADVSNWKGLCLIP